MNEYQAFKVQDLVGKGFARQMAIDALNMCDWDLTQARNYLQSQGGGAREEQDELKRALEMSKSTTGINNFQTNNQMNFLSDLEPLTLEERQRIGNTPVGLKNIGNTCYLNSFIQALFHLPIVMEKVMALEDSAELQRQSSLNAMKRIESSYKLIIELKKLFAFMTKSEKRYADPTSMIRNIVDDFGNQMKIGDQQDITEVSEGFMSRIHEGFEAIANPYANQEDNPFAEEEDKKQNEEGSDHPEDSSDDDSSNLPLLDRVEEYNKKYDSEGFIKDLFFGKQIETTECDDKNTKDDICELEFLLIILEISVRFPQSYRVIIIFMRRGTKRQGLRWIQGSIFTKSGGGSQKHQKF